MKSENVRNQKKKEIIKKKTRKSEKVGNQLGHGWDLWSCLSLQDFLHEN